MESIPWLLKRLKIRAPIILSIHKSSCTADFGIFSSIPDFMISTADGELPEPVPVDLAAVAGRETFCARQESRQHHSVTLLKGQCN